MKPPAGTVIALTGPSLLIKKIPQVSRIYFKISDGLLLAFIS